MYLGLLSFALWAGWARAASPGREPTLLAEAAGPHSAQTQPPSADSRGESSARPPQQASPPASPGPSPEGPSAQPENPRPSTQIKPSGHPANPPPKPPVLRHRRKPKAVAKTAEADRPSGGDPSAGPPSKTVVRNGGAQEHSDQIEPGVTTATAEQQRLSTARLLAATDANLKRVEARQLTKAEQSTIEEIRAYMNQARMASDRNDTSRAQTLAYKARLLSDELAGK